VIRLASLLLASSARRLLSARVALLLRLLLLLRLRLRLQLLRLLLLSNQTKTDKQAIREGRFLFLGEGRSFLSSATLKTTITEVKQ
jgi:hypothetical protein